MLVPDLSLIGRQNQSRGNMGYPLLICERNRERSLSSNDLLEIFTLAPLCNVFRFTEGFLSCFIPFIACGNPVLNRMTLTAFTLSRAYNA